MLLSLASEGLFHARWSERIQDEWVRNLLRQRPDLKQEDLQRTCALMSNAIPDEPMESDPNGTKLRLFSAITTAVWSLDHLVTMGGQECERFGASFQTSRLPSPGSGGDLTSANSRAE